VSDTIPGKTTRTRYSVAVSKISWLGVLRCRGGIRMSLSRTREENLGRGSTLLARYVAPLTPPFGRLVVIV
jgi:hypothetical protein